MLTLKAPSRLVELLDKEARSLGLSRSELVRMILADAIGYTDVAEKLRLPRRRLPRYMFITTGDKCTRAFREYARGDIGWRLLSRACSTDTRRAWRKPDRDDAVAVTIVEATPFYKTVCALARSRVLRHVYTVDAADA